MLKKGGYLLLFILLLVLVVGGFRLLSLTLIKNPVFNSKPVNFGTVRMEELLKTEPDWQNLEKMEKQIQQLRAEVETAENPLSQLEMEKYLQLKKQKDVLEKQLEAEFKAEQHNLETLQAELAARLGKVSQGEKLKLQELYQQYLSSPPPAWDTSLYAQERRKLQTQLDNFAADLIFLKDRQITAKRLQMEKEVGEKLQLRKKELDQQLDALEREILKANQQDKINLTFKLQVAQSEEEYKETQKKIRELSLKENQLKDEKRQELEKQFEAERKKEIDNMEKKLTEFKASLEQEVAKQMSAKEAELLKNSKLSQLNLEQFLTRNPQFSKLSGKIEKNLAEQTQQMELKLKQAQIQLMNKMKAREKELMEQLKQTEKGLTSKLMEQSKQMETSSRQEREAKTKQLETLQKQQDELYKQMTENLKGTIAQVAKENDIQIVLTDLLANPKAKDLTGACLNKLKEKTK